MMVKLFPKGCLKKEIGSANMHTASIPRLSGVSSRIVSFSSTAITSGCNENSTNCKCYQVNLLRLEETNNYTLGSRKHYEILFCSYLMSFVS